MDVQKPPSFTAFSLEMEGALALIAQIDSMFHLCRNRFSFLSRDRCFQRGFHGLGQNNAFNLSRDRF